MLKKKELLKTKEYWIEEIQNEISNQVVGYMKKNNLNQNELAENLGFSKGYVSKILKGECNFSIKKLVELSLALGKAPLIKYLDLEECHKRPSIKKSTEVRFLSDRTVA